MATATPPTNSDIPSASMNWEPFACGSVFFSQDLTPKDDTDTQSTDLFHTFIPAWAMELTQCKGSHHELKFPYSACISFPDGHDTCLDEYRRRDSASREDVIRFYDHWVAQMFEGSNPSGEKAQQWTYRHYRPRFRNYLYDLAHEPVPCQVSPASNHHLIVTSPEDAADTHTHLTAGWQPSRSRPVQMAPCFAHAEGWPRSGSSGTEMHLIMHVYPDLGIEDTEAFEALQEAEVARRREYQAVSKKYTGEAEEEVPGDGLYKVTSLPMIVSEEGTRLEQFFPDRNKYPETAGWKHFGDQTSTLSFALKDGYIFRYWHQSKSKSGVSCCVIV